jgi:hypothetical protein
LSDGPRTENVVVLVEKYKVAVEQTLVNGVECDFCSEIKLSCLETTEQE